MSTASSVPIWITAVNAAPGIAPAEQLGEDPQVRAAGDRQELGQPLEQAEDDGLEEVPHGHDPTGDGRASRVARLTATFRHAAAARRAAPVSRSPGWASAP